MVDLEDRLRPVAESLLAPDEEMLGCCVATQSSLFKGRMAAIAVTEDRLIVQGMGRELSRTGSRCRCHRSGSRRRAPRQALGEWFGRYAEAAGR